MVNTKFFLTCYSTAATIALTTISLSFYADSTYTPPNCDGGNYLTAFNAVAAAGGVTYDAAWPYDPSILQCDKTKNDYAVTVTKYSQVQGKQAMIDHVLGGGTLVVSVDASAFGPYKSGIFSDCPASTANHAVQIVGVNVDEGYWIIRNSWGNWWGDLGYMKLALVRVHP